MGFFGTLTGWDQVGEANNAVVAHHLVETSSTELKKKIISCIIDLQRSVKGPYAGTLQQILADLDAQPRSVQMNFVALACNNLGIAPSLPGSYFDKVQNPYKAKSSDLADRIASTIRQYTSRSGVGISWPGENAKVRFSDWV
jgi:hypothetical protein